MPGMSSMTRLVTLRLRTKSFTRVTSPFTTFAFFGLALKR